MHDKGWGKWGIFQLWKREVPVAGLELMDMGRIDEVMMKAC